MRFNLRKYKNIVFLTGAGISISSGLKSYRGMGSDRDYKEIEKISHVDRLKDNPLSIWHLFNLLRTASESAKPNNAHLVLAQIEKKLKPSQNFTLITQNVDRLHYKAGSKNFIELHGTVTETCCSNSECDLIPFRDRKEYNQEVPLCTKCNSVLKPNVVLFGERIPLDKEWQVKQVLRKCDFFMAIGTSGTVFPAANYVRSAEYSGARTIYLNLEKMNPKNPYFQEEYIGKSEILLPKLFRGYLSNRLF